MFSLSDSRSHAKLKMGEGLEGRTKVLSDDKFKALNKALKIDKKKPQGKEMFSLTRLFCSVTTSAIIGLVARAGNIARIESLLVFVLHLTS